ncbi:MAG: DUF2786 domain-containing protein [Polyangia bacterium]
MSSPRAEDSVQLELDRLTVHALRRTWAELNQSHFRGSLRPSAILLADVVSFLGQWQPEHRTIAIARAALRHGWGIVVEVLKHEMAHQHVEENLGLSGEGHGPAFRSLCERLGIDGRPAGLPEALPTDDPTAKLISRVEKLLSLAQSGNEHEAASAMRTAQRLMLQHNLEALVKPDAAQRRYVFRHLGRPKARTTESERRLATLLGAFFFVEIIWVPVWRADEGKRGTQLEICGTPENVELASYVHGFLTHTAERLYREYKHDEGLDGDSARQSYLAGVIAGFHEKLQAERRREQDEALVWVGDPALSRYLRRRHPHVRMSYNRGRDHGSAGEAGRSAGRGIVLQRTLHRGGTQTGPRLLTGR